MAIGKIDLRSIILSEATNIGGDLSTTASLSKKNQILLGMAPLLMYCYKNINLSRANSQHLSRLLTSRKLKQIINNHLSQILLPILSRTLVLEMHIAKSNAMLQEKTSSRRFSEFMLLIAQPQNQIALLDKYPELERTITLSAEQYLNSMHLFLDHLENDWHRLTDVFFHGQAGIKLINIIATGDTHCNGKSTLLLKFKSDTSCELTALYKPRSLAIDAAFQYWLSWFNDNSHELKLLTHTTIDCGSYGWSEFIPYDSCKSLSDVQQFYRRSGALLALLYVIGGQDMHAENLIACGAHPVLIDLECLLTPLLKSNQFSHEKQWYSTVSESMLLPFSVFTDEHHAGIDLSGLAGGNKGQRTPYNIMQWAHYGTDEMRIVRKPVLMQTHNNQPTLNNLPISVFTYEDSLLYGFELAYRLIMKKKTFLLSHQSPLALFKHCDSRVLLRNTDDYGHLLNESFHPTLLQKSSLRKKHIALLRNFKTFNPFYVDMIRAEEKDIINCNIPFFTASVARKQCFDSDRRKLNVEVLQSGWQRLQVMLKEKLNERDLCIQKNIIRASFKARQMNEDIITSKSHSSLGCTKNKSKKISLLISSKPTLSALALKNAKKILDELSSTCMINGKNIKWPTLELAFDQSWTPGLTDHFFYDGNMGIGLIFAYAAKIFNSTKYKHIALACLNSVRSARKEEEFIKRAIGKNAIKASQNFTSIGAFGGCSSLLYPLAKFQRLFPSTATITQLRDIAAYLEKQIKQDQILDVIGGAAGLILGINAVKEYLPNQLFHSILRKSARHIIKNYPSPEQFPIIGHWDDLTQPQIGFAHGTSGIILALAIYNEHHHSVKITEWIHRALRYERENFCAQNQNWPQFRHDDKKNNLSSDRFMMAWCYGAPGIGLSRLALKSRFCHPEIDAEIHCITQKTFNDYHLSKELCLCHGQLGNLDVLIHQRENNQCFEQFKACLDHSLTQITQQGYHSGLQGHGSIPGLMIGSAGVAYQLMRAAHPSKVPSLLMFE